MTKRIFLIGTTAINRPDMHTENITEWYNWILKLQDQYDLHWVINIDLIENLPATYEQTSENFQRIIKEIPCTIIGNQEGKYKGNFQMACKRVAVKIHELIGDINTDLPDLQPIIMWLEDDWKINSCPLDIHIIMNYLTDYAYINLSGLRTNYIWALAPSIISYKFWHLLHYTAWNSLTEKMDPEHALGKWYVDKYKKEINIVNLTVSYNHSLNLKVINRSDVSFYTFYCNNHDESTTNDHVSIKCKHLDFTKYPINKYMDFNTFKQKYNDTHVFIRFSILDSIGVNYGRTYLEKFNLIKIGKCKIYNENFYTKIK